MAMTETSTTATFRVDDGPEVTVFKPSNNVLDYPYCTFSWPSCGAVPVEQAEKFLAALQEAVQQAKKADAGFKWRHEGAKEW